MTEEEILDLDNTELSEGGSGYDKPARNKPRGNILDGGFQINWTGPLYL